MEANHDTLDNMRVNRGLDCLLGAVAGIETIALLLTGEPVGAVVFGVGTVYLALENHRLSAEIATATEDLG